MKDTLTNISDSIANKQRMFIVTANTEMVMLCQNNEQFRNILCKAQLVLPDGIGVVWAGKYLGQQVPERVAGFDLTQELFAVAEKKKARVYFLGAAPGIAQKAADVAIAQYPKLKVAGCRDGYFSADKNLEIVDEINRSETDILLAALGAPKQEVWLYEHSEMLQAKILLGVGGTFDVMAGTAMRAPKTWQNMGLEWLYRLLMQPSRFIRMLSIPHFMCKVLFSKKH